MLKAQQLYRQYGDLIAVDDVSFEISRRQIIGLLGQNGAGKTTIMKMITGFLEPGSGCITINGVDVNQHRIEIRNKIGYLPENCPVYAEMTVIDFLFYTAGLRNLNGQTARRAVQQAILKTDLGAKASQRIDTLSRGYRQRVGVAQAILAEPELLILDEPTNGLDPSQIENMRGLLKTLTQTATVIISTHVLQEVSAVCDRVLILKQGRLALDSELAVLQQGGCLLITVDQPPDRTITELQTSTALESVDYLGEEQGGHGYRLVPVQAASLTVLTPEITRTLVGLGYNVSRITPEMRDLETVFREINQRQVS